MYSFPDISKTLQEKLVCDKRTSSILIHEMHAKIDSCIVSQSARNSIK